MGDPRVFLRVKLGAGGEMDVGPAISRIDVHDEDRGTDRVTLVMDDHVGISTDVIQRVTRLNLEIHRTAGGTIDAMAVKLVRDGIIWSHLAGDTTQRLKAVRRLLKH